MSELEFSIDGEPATPITGWSLSWVDRSAGFAQLTDGTESISCLVEGAGSEWVVTLRGRRIPVTARTWRERVLAEAESSAARHAGPAEVQATLPGLVVAVAVRDGDEVAEGATLLTIEAMKMQNEVRSPRAGRVAAVTVAPGQTVSAGAPLLRIE
ncbi:MAG: biotin/lipoyl-containing protein [Chloroflexota bacterium]